MTEKTLQRISAEPMGRRQYFLKLAVQSLVRYGAIATIQADYIRRLLEALKLDAEFTILPGQTTIFMKEDVSPSQGVNVLTFKTGLGYNFDKLQDVEGAVSDAIEGRLFEGLDEAVSVLEKIQRRPNPFGAWVHPVGWSLIAGIVTVLLGGRFLDGAVGLFTGLVFGLCLVLLDYVPALAFTFDFWVSFLVSFLLGVTKAFIVRDLLFWPTFLASVILILPGFSMSMGFTDVFSKQIVFGLTTLFNAAWTALSIGLGAFMGLGLVRTIAMTSVWPTLPGVGYPTYPIWVHILLYPAFNILLNMTFQANMLQAVVIAPMATAAFTMFFLLMGKVCDEANILCSVLFMGIIGHIFGRVSKVSELPTVLSGIIVFAPGTYGARSSYYIVDAIVRGIKCEGLETDELRPAVYALMQAGGMLTVAGAIALGFLLSRALFGRI